MMKKEITSERYHNAFDKVHASAELLRKVEDMPNHEIPQKSRRSPAGRRLLAAAAVAVTLLVLSNLVVLAATGETWVGRIFWHDEKPNQPMENVRKFFMENGDKLGGDPARARADYYGGTYLDGGEQVILLTDLSHADEFAEVGEFIRFEKCEYTYAELNGAVRRLNESIPTMHRRGEGYAPDVTGWGVDDQANRVFITIYQMTEEKVQWFRENVLDAPYLVFHSADAFPQDD